MRGVVFLLAILFLISSATALSNESIQAKELLDQANMAISELNQSSINTSRTEELYSAAYNTYVAQSSLEDRGKTGDFKLTIKYSEEILKLRDEALNARDELKVFLAAYDEAAKDYNLSSMDKEYNSVLRSFSEERFEETIPLIDEAYTKLSNIQSSQTQLRAYYGATTNSLRSFFVDNWMTILVTLIVLFVLFLIFRRVIKIYLIKQRIKSLEIRKKALKKLLEKQQYEYFEKKSISEGEYKTKLEKFKDMIRDVDRQIPLLNAEMLKVQRKK